MLKMFLERACAPFRNQRGIGLITAIFVIVVVAMFGTLIARYATIGATSSVEDYLWAQALYSAQSAAQVAVLYNDDGVAGSENLKGVAGFTTAVVDIANGVTATADRTVEGTSIHRKIVIHFTK